MEKSPENAQRLAGFTWEKKPSSASKSRWENNESRNPFQAGVVLDRCALVFLQQEALRQYHPLCNAVDCAAGGQNAMLISKPKIGGLIRKHGKLKVIIALITVPVWLPIIVVLRAISALCIQLGELGEWLRARVWCPSVARGSVFGEFGPTGLPLSRLSNSLLNCDLKNGATISGAVTPLIATSRRRTLRLA